MRKKIDTSITPVWNKAKQLIAEGRLVEADDALMTIIWRVADYTMSGHPDSLKVENISIAVWKERAWTAIEKAGLLPN
jgi:hypothetical protein